MTRARGLPARYRGRSPAGGMGAVGGGGLGGGGVGGGRIAGGTGAGGIASGGGTPGGCGCAGGRISPGGGGTVPGGTGERGGRVICATATNATNSPQARETLATAGFIGMHPFVLPEG